MIGEEPVSEFVFQQCLFDAPCFAAVLAVFIGASRGFMKPPLQLYWIIADAYLRS